jgi:hypothetical protein
MAQAWLLQLHVNQLLRTSLLTVLILLLLLLLLQPPGGHQ